MSEYFGDFAEDETVYIPFNTFDSNDPSASVTITNLAAADIKVHKDGSVTQIVTDGATVTIDFDGITGNHLITIDTSADAAYTTGTEYQVRIEGTTVDAATINAWVGSFSIERTGGAIALLTGTNSLANIEDKIDIIDTNVDQIETAVITNAAGTDIAADIIAVKSDTTAILVDTSTTLDTKINTIDTNVDSILVDTAEIGSAGAGLTAINLPNQTMDITGNLSGSVGSLTGHTNQTADHTANIASILTDTGTTLDTKLNDLQGAGFSTSTDSNEAIRNRGDAAWTTGAGGSDRLLMVDTTIATLSTQTSFTLTAGSTDNDAYNNLSIVIEDVSTATQKSVGMVLDYVGSTKTITLKEALAFTIATTDKVYILAENSLKSTVANRQLDITATGAAGIDWANVENPTTALDLSGTDIQLVDTATTVTGGATSSALATVDTNVDSILVDTAEIGAAGAGLTALSTQASVDVIDTNVDQIETAVITNAAGTDIAADIIAVKGETATIVADTNELQADWANAGRLDTILDSRMAEASISTTGGAVDTVTTVTNQVSVSDILTTQMTEAYAADGTAPTLAQALFLIQQSIGDFAIAGTTITTKKIDGSTTAATYTLDDGTSPTSRTRTT